MNLNHHSTSIADMENSATGTSLCSARHHGNKRKHNENAFTAKAESGTLKVKIMRQDQRSAGKMMDTLSSTTSSKTKKRRAAKPSHVISDSPPKPRPNRKHVPIFYEPQFRQPIKQRGGLRSSIHELGTYSTSSTDVPNIYSTASSEVSAACKTTTTLKFVSQMPDVKRQSTRSSRGDADIPPKTDPVFLYNDTDGLETLSELLRSYFPSSGPSGLYSNPAGTMSSARLLVDPAIGLTSALHQLASSSALYRSTLDELPTRPRVHPLTLSFASESAVAADISASSALATTTTLTKSSGTIHDMTKKGLETYRFDTLSALQTAIDDARRTSSANESVNQQCDEHRGNGSINSCARFYKLKQSETTHKNKTTSTAARIGAQPDVSSFLTLQNSLLEGKIQHSTHSKLHVNVDGDKVSTPSDDSTNGTVNALGPSLDAPPSFVLQNSLMSGGISLLNLPRTRPSLDRPGSLTSLICQANETAEDLNSALVPESKMCLSLDRLLSITSLDSEDSGCGKSPSVFASLPPAIVPDTVSAYLNTIQDTPSNETVDLGPPPSGPPAFTVGNSLIGGGIELQPAAAIVNTHNFDWKLHRAASNTSENETSSPEVTRV